MDLFEVIKVLVRRWYVVLPIGLLTLLLALVAHAKTPPEYEATGYLQLQSPEFDRADDPTSADIDPVALSQGAEVGDASVSVSPLDGQYFTVLAADQTSQDAEAAVESVISHLELQVAAVQEGQNIPEGQRVDLRMAVPDISVEIQEDATHVASARLFLYNPSNFSVNPYPVDAYTGRLLQVGATGDAGRQRFAERAGDDVAFQVEQDSRDAATLMQVVTTGSDPQRVVEAFYVVQALMAEDLDARQARADVAPTERITLEVLDAPLGANDVSPPVTRAVIAILGLGAMLAIGSAIGTESVAARRARSGDDEDPRIGVPADATGGSEPATNGERSAPVLFSPTPTDRRDRVPPPSIERQSSSGRVPRTSEPSVPDAQPSEAPAAGTGPGMVRIDTGEGALDAYMALPGGGPAPGVIVIQDWWGMNGQVRRITERLAESGFVALAPDLVGGTPTHDEREVDQLLARLSTEVAAGKLTSAVDYLQAHPAVARRPLGVIGFGIGGGLGLVVGAREPSRVGAVVAYYAVGDYETADLSGTTAAILGHFGAKDDVVTPDDARGVEAKLEASSASTVFIRIHQDARHAFADEADHFGTYDQRLATATWEQSVAFLRDVLTRSWSMAD